MGIFPWRANSSSLARAGEDTSRPIQSLKLENYPGLQSARPADPDARASARQHPASEIPETIDTATPLVLPGRRHCVLRARASRQTLRRHRSTEFFRQERRQRANRLGRHQEPSIPVYPSSTSVQRDRRQSSARWRCERHAQSPDHSFRSGCFNRISAASRMAVAKNNKINQNGGPGIR